MFGDDEVGRGEECRIFDPGSELEREGAGEAGQYMRREVGLI